MFTSQGGRRYPYQTGCVYLSRLLLPSLWLLEATAGRLLPPRLDVVVYLELGLVGLLRRSVLQLPGGDRQRDTGSNSRCRRRWACGMQHRLVERAQRKRENGEETYLRFHQNVLGMSRLVLLLLRSSSGEDKASPTLYSSTPPRTCCAYSQF